MINFPYTFRVCMAWLCLLLPFAALTQRLPGRYHERIDSILQANEVPGATVVLADSSGRLRVGYFGLADVSADRPVTDSTLFCIGSVAKTFLAAGTLIAAQKGLLSLSDPLHPTLPEGLIRNRWRPEDPVRLIHLLEHTAGIDEAHFHLTARAGRDTPLQEVLKLSRTSLEVRWRPGSYAEYNTLDYVAAAHMLQEKTGKSLEHFMQEELFEPLNLGSATYRPDEEKAYYFTKGYESDGQTEIAFPGLPQWPAGALSLTAGDMGKFLKILIQKGRTAEGQVLTPESIVRMETPETSLRVRAGTVTGYGKGLQATYYNGKLYYGHSGRYGGFQSDFGYSRQTGTGYAILVNQANGRRAVKEIKKLLLADMAPFAYSLSPRPDLPEDMAYIRGAYQPVTGVPQLGRLSDCFMKIADLQIVEPGPGQVSVSGPLFEGYSLLHFRGNLFRTISDSGPTVVFTQGEEGKSLMLTEDGAYQRIPVWQAYTTFYTAVAVLITIVLCFLIWIIRLPILLIRRKKIVAEWLPFLAIVSFVAMVVSFTMLYDPEKLYSTGAILFYLFGWLFLVVALASLGYGIYLLLHNRIGRWPALFTLAGSLASSVMAAYLWYCGIIGLPLWAY
ncbi:MAG: serine hydrolase domain-containing protein [Cyclobacteriaceae bacterium]